MPYIENPKTAGSDIVCAIPQSGTYCPMRCEHCFFLGGRSYLEPLKHHLPNLPKNVRPDQIVRINDGLDSGVDWPSVRDYCASLHRSGTECFLNTAIPIGPHTCSGWPYMLTINPGRHTDTSFFGPNPRPLPRPFAVRFRANTWNVQLAREAVRAWTPTPVILTFMAYTTEIKSPYYTHRQRTLNPYWVVTQEGWDLVCSAMPVDTAWYTCGRDADTHACKHCRNCEVLYRCRNKYY